MSESIKFKLFSDVGMNELFMARLFHFQDRILSGLFGGKDNEAIQQAIMTVLFDGLEPAFRSLRSLREKWDDEAVPEKEKIQLVQNVYTYLVVAFKDRFQDVAKKMGYDIGFIFKKQDNFNQGCKNFFKKHPKIDPLFVTTIKEDRIWIELMIGVRNNIIDHKVGKDPAFIERLSHFLNLETAEIMFDNSWRSIEDFLIVFANDITDPKYGMKILELSAYKMNKDNSERFCWFDIEDQKQAKN